MKTLKPEVKVREGTMHDSKKSGLPARSSDPGAENPPSDPAILEPAIQEGPPSGIKRTEGQLSPQDRRQLVADCMTLPMDRLKAIARHFHASGEMPSDKLRLAETIAAGFDFEDQAAFDRFFSGLPPELGAALETAAFSATVSADRLAKVTGKEILEQLRGFGGYSSTRLPDNSSLYGLFVFSVPDSLLLPRFFRKIIAHWLSKPEGFDPEPLASVLLKAPSVKFWATKDTIADRARLALETASALVKSETRQTIALKGPTPFESKKIAEQCGLDPFPVGSILGLQPGRLLVQGLAAFCPQEFPKVASAHEAIEATRGFVAAFFGDKGSTWRPDPEYSSATFELRALLDHLAKKSRANSSRYSGMPPARRTFKTAILLVSEWEKKNFTGGNEADSGGQTGWFDVEAVFRACRMRDLEMSILPGMAECPDLALRADSFEPYARPELPRLTGGPGNPNLVAHQVLQGTSGSFGTSGNPAPVAAPVLQGTSGSLGTPGNPAPVALPVLQGTLNPPPPPRRYIRDAHEKNLTLKPEFHDEALGLPLFRAYACLFGVLGLLELAETPAPPQIRRDRERFPLSVYDGLFAIRLTELGRWCLGLSGDRPEHTADNSRIVPDPVLPVAVLDPGSLRSRLFMETIGTRLGADRYHITEESLTRDCKSAEEMQTRVMRIRELSDSGLPPAWERRLEKALARMNSFGLPERALVFHLPPDPELFSLFDPRGGLAHLCWKAEGGRIVVPEAGLEAFAKALNLRGIHIPIDKIRENKNSDKGPQ